MVGKVRRSNQRLLLVNRYDFRMKCSHLIVFLVVIVYFKKATFISEDFIKIRLLIYIIDEELYKNSSLALLNDGINQIRKI